MLGRRAAQLDRNAVQMLKFGIDLVTLDLEFLNAILYGSQQ